MKKIILPISLLFCISISSFAQNGLQKVKGVIIDKQSEIPLIGATINLIADPSLGAITDIDGNFVIENIPVGRQAFEINYLGYEPLVIPNVEISSGKEVYLNVVMEESLVELEEIVITAAANKDRTINDMATVSARQFSMEEVNRYSGGRSDVGRLAGNFAGVSTADDSRNDIVIRGNSPTGLLWRLEGIPIPSPNHFSTVGTTGGPVSALNTNLLKSSDFLTSAFPAEYGNALSGVFDLGFRSGNKDKMEYTFQLGATTGIEAMVEGPLSKKNNSSFLIAYRYSFIGVAQSLGAEIGTNAVPQYDDLSFKFDFGKSKFGNFTLFGIGGRSDIEFLSDEVDETDLFAADDEDARAESFFGVIGLKHNLLLSDNTYLRTVVAYSGNNVIFGRDRYYNLDTPAEVVRPFVIADDGQERLSISSFVNKKYNKRLTLKAGGLLERVTTQLNMQSAEFAVDDNNDGIFDLQEVYNFDEDNYTIQPYAQAQYRVTSKLTLNAGLRGLYYSINEDFALEPRLAINYKLAEKHKLNLGYGLHNQAMPLPIQLASLITENGPSNPNRTLGFIKSNQFVLGHDFKINDSWRSKVEVYYQSLSNVPVDKTSSTYSVLNEGADFGFSLNRNNLTSAGTGSNRGIELTIEKFFNQGYYVLATGSLFDSKYTASDGIERNTAFNNQYVGNLLLGKEISWGKQKQHRITLDTKVTSAGGRFYTPVDLEASRVNEIQVFDEANAFSEQYSPYFRWDIKFGIKLNNTKRKFSQAFYLDIQNVTNNENIFRRSYNRVTNEVNDILQLGFFPNFIYKVEF